MAFTVYMAHMMYTNGEVPVLSKIEDGTVRGMLAVFIGFAPLFVVGIISGIWTILSKKQPD